ncbi:MAG: hypothetical protein FWF01_03765 [Alphaproteobacteria bacterium]|nr:hypothetical protein [Alphaproteobacteria bacterium]
MAELILYDPVKSKEKYPLEEIPVFLEMAFNETDDEMPHSLICHLAWVMQARRNKLMKEGNPSGVMHEALIRSLTEDEQPSFKTVAEVLDTCGYRVTIAPKTGDYLIGPPTLNGALNTMASRKPKKQKAGKSTENNT